MVPGGGKDDSVAQCYLGVCYLDGLGVPQEFSQAAKWLREAAEQNDPAPQFNLGILCQTGQGVPQNYVEAVKWYTKRPSRASRRRSSTLVSFTKGNVVP